MHIIPVASKEVNWFSLNVRSVLRKGKWAVPDIDHASSVTTPLNLIDATLKTSGIENFTGSVGCGDREMCTWC